MVNGTSGADDVLSCTHLVQGPVHSTLTGAAASTPARAQGRHQLPPSLK